MLDAKCLMAAGMAVVASVAVWSRAPMAEAAAPQEFEVGENRVGEPCRTLASGSGAAAGLTTQNFKIFCGRWEHPSGRVFQVTSAGAPAALAAWTGTGWWKQEIERRMVCGAGQPTSILDGAEALAFLDCKLRTGGWPFIALVAKVGNTVYLASGVPALAQNIETTIAVAAGRRAATAAPEAEVAPSAAIREIDARLGDRMYGSGDLQTYLKLMEAGWHYNNIHDFDTAEKRYREAMALHQRLLGLDDPEAADPLMHLALAVSNQERFVEADALFKRVEGLVSQMADQGDQARYLTYLSLHAANQRDFDKALELARQATSVRRSLASEAAAAAAEPGQAFLPGLADATAPVVVERPPAGNVELAQGLYLEAMMLRQIAARGRAAPAVAAETPEQPAALAQIEPAAGPVGGVIAQVESLVQEATSVLPQVDVVQTTMTPRLLDLGADVGAARGAFQEAGVNLQTAITLRHQYSPMERTEGLTYLERGRLYRAEGRLDEALQAFRTGAEIIRDTGGSLRFHQVYPYLTTILEAARARPDQRDALYTEAFAVGQLARSGITVDNITLAAARLSEGEDRVGELIRTLQDAQDERVELYRQYEQEIARPPQTRDPERVQQLSTRIVEINQQISELGLQVQAASPGYNQLVDTVVDAGRVFDLLRPDEALVQVLLGRPESFVFVVRQGRISFYSIALTEPEAAQIVRRLRAAFEVTPQGTIPAFDVAAAHDLYLRLFRPALPQIETAGHLITVPTGSLLSLPFGILVTEAPASVRGDDYSKVAWLMKRSASSLVPSVRSFVDLRAIAQPSRAPKAFVGFGGFVPHVGDGAAEAGGAVVPAECLTDPQRGQRYLDMLRALGPLPGTVGEVRAVANSFPNGSVSVLLGDKFNESAVARAGLDDYRVIYFATHGLLPTEFDCRSEPSLALSLSAKPAEGEDGFLSLSEILRLKLDADLVVLSACNTGGAGTSTGGESLSGLARAFFYAGTRSLLVSHWYVDDVSTANMMTHMFGQLREAQQLGAASALRLAQLRIIDGAARSGDRLRTHPFFWAPFTLVGDGARAFSGT
jgi:CHAT domain-containing protein